MNRNYRVPDFEVYDDESANPPSTSQARPKKSAVGEEEVTELVWQNGQVVLQSQNQRPQRRSANIGDAALPAPEGDPAVNFFMQEDEMSNWLQYPLDDSTPFDRDLYADLLNYPTTCAPTRLAPTSDVLNQEFRPRKRPDAPAVDPVHDFSPLSRRMGRVERGGGGPSIEPTVVDSSDTPALRVPPKSRSEHNFNNSTVMHISGRGLGYPTTTRTARATAIAPSSAAGGETYELATSPGNSGASASASVEPATPKPAPPVIEDRKRKGRETAAADEASWQNEDVDVDVEYSDVKKRVHGSTSTKRSRAAEVHNQSERRRRDRINVKMKALQELIPRCNKSDKASMLDEAIEYLKSLQMQVQMMSMGCTMVPMMFPGVQHYMPSVGMGMGIDMGMIRPMMQFPPVLPGPPGVPNQTGTNMAPPRFPIPNFHLPSDPNRIQMTNLPVPDLMLNPSSQNLTHAQMLQQQNIVNPYQQYLLMQQSQNPTMINQPNNTNNPGGNDHGNLQSG